MPTPLTFLFAAATDFRAKDKAAKCKQYLAAAARKSYNQLRDTHITDHRRFFRRMQLDLNWREVVDLPTDERLKRVEAGETDLASRSAVLSVWTLSSDRSSRPGTMAANLQGKWNDNLSRRGTASTRSTSTPR